mmetsp:Transcript_98185/g.282406  ORF Transcript_98185/g.282406 Transcript_98185/m.282406 type:complete len:82 (+) Transcript_98185:758-1003(+)
MCRRALIPDVSVKGSLFEALASAKFSVPSANPGKAKATAVPSGSTLSPAWPTDFFSLDAAAAVPAAGGAGRGRGLAPPTLT